MRRIKVLLITVLITGAVFVLYAVRVAWVHVLHDDACHVIALEIAARKADNGAVSDREMRAMIAELINASVIRGRIDGDGSPTDLNGNSFAVCHDEKRVSVATRRSFWEPFAVERKVPVE